MSVVAVCSGKGAPGATAVAIGLAAAFASAGRDVLLVDLDLAGGDVAAYLRLNPRRGLLPLMAMQRAVPSADALVAEAESRSGFSVIAGFPEPLRDAQAFDVAAFVAQARATGRLVVCDVGRVTHATATAIEQADVVVLVVRADLVSVLGAERALGALDASVPRERLHLVINCVRARHPADAAEVTDALGLSCAGVVPADERAMRRAMTTQAPVTDGPVARALQRIAESVLVAAAVSTPAATTVLEEVAL